MLVISHKLWDHDYFWLYIFTYTICELSGLFLTIGYYIASVCLIKQLMIM